MNHDNFNTCRFVFLCFRLWCRVFIRQMETDNKRSEAVKCRTPSCTIETEPNQKTGEPKYCPACRKARHLAAHREYKRMKSSLRFCPQCSDPLEKGRQLCDTCKAANIKESKNKTRLAADELRFKRTGCQFSKPHGCCPGPRYRVNLSGKERIWCENALIKAKSSTRRPRAWEKIA